MPATVSSYPCRRCGKGPTLKCLLDKCVPKGPAKDPDDPPPEVPAPPAPPRPRRSSRFRPAAPPAAPVSAPPAGEKKDRFALAYLHEAGEHTWAQPAEGGDCETYPSAEEARQERDRMAKVIGKKGLIPVVVMTRRNSKGKHTLLGPVNE